MTDKGKQAKLIRVHKNTPELLKKKFPHYRSSFDRSVRLNEMLEEMLFGKKKIK